MADLLIRDVPEDVVARIDAQAAALGVSRAEYLRRRLSSDLAWPSTDVTVESLRHLADLCADLGDPTIMSAAWR